MPNVSTTTKAPRVHGFGDLPCGLKVDIYPLHGL